MNTQLLAQVKCLEYKLDAIRGFCEMHLGMDPNKIELAGVLQLIKRREAVPCGWELSKPLVEEDAK